MRPLLKRPWARDNLPKNTVSAAEYYDLGSALENSYDYSRAKELYRKAADSATDLNIAVAALRKSAEMEFATGQPQSGRALFERALDIFGVYPTSNDLLIKSTNVYTELAWAEAEGTSGNSNGLLQHVANARQLVNSLPYTPAAKMLSAMVESQEKLFSNPAAGPTAPAPGVAPH